MNLFTRSLFITAICTFAPTAAHAVQFIYFAGTEINATSEAQAISGVGNPNNGFRVESESDDTLTPGNHAVFTRAYSFTFEELPGPSVDTTVNALSFYGENTFNFTTELSAVLAKVESNDQGIASASALQSVVFEVDTTGIYRLYGDFAFDGDGEAGGSVSLSTGYAQSASLIPPGSGALESYDHMVELEAGVQYQLLAQATGEIGTGVTLTGSFEFVSVPEPAAWIILVLGAIGALSLRRRARPL